METDDERRRTLVWLVKWADAENDAPNLGDPYQVEDPPPAFEDTACKCIRVTIDREEMSGEPENPQGICRLTAVYSTKTPGTGQNHDVIREWDLAAKTKTVKTDLSTPPKLIRGGDGMSIAVPSAVYRYKIDRTSLDHDTIMDLTGTVNDNAFLGKQARTFLFLGARAVRKNFELWSITYELLYSKLNTDLKEYGHYGFWDPPLDRNGVQPPTEVYRLYHDGDFSRLDIGSG